MEDAPDSDPCQRLTYRVAQVGHAPSRPQDEEEQAPKPAPVAKYVVSGGLTGFSVANDIHFIDFDAVDPKTPYAESKAIPWNMEINPDVGASQCCHRGSSIHGWMLGAGCSPTTCSHGCCDNVYCQQAP